MKLELGTEKVIETKQGKWDKGEVKARVLVRGCTEYNK